ILADLEMDKETIVAGLLHDVVEDTIMTDEEIDWLNDYHAMVRSRLLPLLTAEEADWLTQKTNPLTR
ncbi:MAG: M24 family metallopeptidase C-terminal domain-containing protein, partial [Lachnospiraceae bacterium]|nr:M24 family metallopeptidase C-terminal domain-containing protein [Lachnospiraceae bacterium]